MKYQIRRLAATLIALVGVVAWIFISPASYEKIETSTGPNSSENAAENSDNSSEKPNNESAVSGSENREKSGNGAELETGKPNNRSAVSASENNPLASAILERLEVKGRAPKTGYSRSEFYGSWPTVDGCNLRQRIIKREFGDTAVLDGCNVLAGEYDEPYTGEHKVFTTREQISKGIQIDHVVALSDAWQKGAQYFSAETRYYIATDPLNLLAVDSTANSNKSDGDAATWLPPSKKFRCQYVARQVSVKYKYALWVTVAEKEAIFNVLSSCPNEPAVGV